MDAGEQHSGIARNGKRTTSGLTSPMGKISFSASTTPAKTEDDEYSLWASIIAPNNDLRNVGLRNDSDDYRCPCSGCSLVFAAGKMVSKKNMQEITAHIVKDHYLPCIDKTGFDMERDGARLDAFVDSVSGFCVSVFKKSCKDVEKLAALEVLREAYRVNFLPSLANGIQSKFAPPLKDDTMNSLWESIIAPENDLSAVRLRNESDDYRCPCANCSLVFAAGKKVSGKNMQELTVHIVRDHYLPHIESAGFDIAANGSCLEAFAESVNAFCVAVFKKSCKESERQAAVAELREGYRVNFLANKIGINTPTSSTKPQSEKPPTSQRKMKIPLDNNSTNATSMKSASKAPSSSKKPNSLNKTSKPAQLPEISEGLTELENTMSSFQSAGLQLAPANGSLMQQIEEFLNKAKMTRDEVTSKASEVFAYRRSVDLYTGWSKEQFDKLVSIPDIDKTDSLFKRKDHRSFCEVDHVWEVQLIHLALREASRFQAAAPSSQSNSKEEKTNLASALLPKYVIGLLELNYLSKLINSPPNLTCTPWNINGYKGKLLKNFRSTYQITENAFNYDVRSFIVGNRNFAFLMKKYPIYNEVIQRADPHPIGGKPSRAKADDGKVGTAASHHSIIDNIQITMRSVLTEFFYKVLFKFDEGFLFLEAESLLLNKNMLKLLYGILCHMYTIMYPNNIDV